MKIKKPKPVTNTDDVEGEKPYGDFRKPIYKEVIPSPIIPKGCRELYRERIASQSDYEEIRQEIPNWNIENLTEIDRQKILKFNDRVKNQTDMLGEAMLQNSVASLLSQERASADIEAICRDILKVDVEVDNSIVIAISQMSKLELILQHAKLMNLNDSIRDKFMGILTEEIAKQTLKRMENEENSQRYSNLLQNTVASMKKKSENAPTNKEMRKRKEEGKNSKYVFTGDYSENMGVTKNRSYRSNSDRIIKESREQIAGERITDLGDRK